MIPYVNLNLDKEYKLRLGMRATIEFERETGLKLMDLNDTVLSSMDILSILLHKMIVKETDDDKKLTVDNVIDLIDNNAENIVSVVEKVSEAIQASFPESKNAQTPVKK